MIDIDKLKVGDIIAYSIEKIYGYNDHIAIDKVKDVSPDGITTDSIYITWTRSNVDLYTTKQSYDLRRYLKRLLAILKSEGTGKLQLLSTQEAKSQIITKIFTSKSIGFHF